MCAGELADTVKKKPDRWRRGRRLVGWIIVFITLGTVSILSIRTVCNAIIPDTVLDESITTFIGNDPYTAHDLILAAERYVSDRIRFVAQAGSSISTLATYRCDGRDCQLEELITEVGTKRYISCFSRAPGNEKMTQFIFDIRRDHVKAETFSFDGGVWLSSRQMRDISPTIDEALLMVFDLVEPTFFERHTMTSVTLSALIDHWEVRVQGLTDNEQVTAQIPFETSASGE